MGSRAPSATIEFTQVPESAPGGAARLERISGHVSGARPGQQIVVFAKSGTWWVQPLSNKPFTAIHPDSTWSSATHMGDEYAALLVNPGYSPPKTTDVLPPPGGAVIAVASVKGHVSAERAGLPPKKIHFSGYDWDVRQTSSDSGGVLHSNRGSNVWTDARGWLHLRIVREGEEWTCAEVNLTRSLGYGSYSFVAHDAARLEPGNVLGMFTWDDAEAGQNHREIDIELSQWGDPASKNAQFTIQPYYVPANVFRFMAPDTALTHSFRWEAGRVSYKTTRRGGPVVAEHVFTSGIPSPGEERVYINLYIYGKSRTQQVNGTEVVFEKFEFLP